MSDSSSQRTVRAAQRGDPEALEALVRRCWPQAYRIAYAVTGDAGAAEDVAQESVLAAIRSLDTFDRRRRFEPWLHRIVVNRAVDWARLRVRRAEVGLSEILEPPASRHGSGISDELMMALLALEPGDRAIVVLRHLFGFSSTEIAEIMESSPGTVRSTLHRALQRLRAQLCDSALSEPQLTKGGTADE